MRFSVITLAAIATLCAENTRTSQKLHMPVYIRSKASWGFLLPHPMEAAERPLFASRDTDYKPGLGSRRKIDRLHVRPERIGRSFSGKSGWQRTHAAHHGPGLR